MRNDTNTTPMTSTLLQRTKFFTIPPLLIELRRYTIRTCIWIHEMVAVLRKVAARDVAFSRKVRFAKLRWYEFWTSLGNTVCRYY